MPNLSALNEGAEHCHCILVYGFVLYIEIQGVTLFTEKKTRSVLSTLNEGDENCHHTLVYDITV